MSGGGTAAASGTSTLDAEQPTASRADAPSARNLRRIIGGPPVGGQSLWRQLRDHPLGRAAGGHALDVVEAVAEARGPVLPGGPGRVRREGHVGEREERV